MPIPTRATLKSYFETADVPTQAQFAAFIDAAYDMAQEATDTAQQAVDDLAAAITAMPPDFFPVLAFCKFTTGGSLANGTYWTPTEESNVASVGMDTGTGLLRITFDAANADTNYKVEYYTRRSGVETGTTLAISTENANWVEFTMSGAGPHTLRDFFIIVRQDWSV